MKWTKAVAAAAAAAVAGVAARDLVQKRHALLRNFPVLGHARYLVEAIGPELRQYLVAANNEERPFTRDQRRWVYASAKQENNCFDFGTPPLCDLVDVTYLRVSWPCADLCRDGRPAGCWPLPRRARHCLLRSDRRGDRPGRRGSAARCRPR